MARVFSGVQPTGGVHIGNYLGAFRHFEAHPDHLYCVVDLHSLTMPYDPEELHRNTLLIASVLIALGLHEKSTVFVQSQVPAHSELAWMLNCVATVGELNRMTQFKDKGRGQKSVSAGLLNYPVLMAADILLYQTDEVPVGNDQQQHLELTRDLAERFNARFGETFTVPRGRFPKTAARVMSLTDPVHKMSKSDEDPNSKILLLDDVDIVRKKIMRAVTDSGSDVRHDRDAKAGISNLMEIMAACTGQSLAEIETEYGSRGYGTFKRAVADATVETLRPFQESLRRVLADPAMVEAILQRGGEAAAARAAPTLAAAKRRMGLPPTPA